VNREIVALRDSGEILSFCEARIDEFNVVNLVTAVHRVAKNPDAKAALDGRLLGLLE